MREHMKLLYATSNEGKLLAMRRCLEPLNIELIGLRDLDCAIPKAEENGNTPLENARIKAKAYFEAFAEQKLPVFSCDSGLYFENVPEEYQPGIYVRRPSGYELTDEEMTEYYSGLAKRFGALKAQYRNAVCFYKNAHEIYESEAPELSGEPFLIVEKPHPKSQSGFPLDRLSVEISSGKYYYDLQGNAQDKLVSDVDRGFLQFFKKICC